MKTASVQRKMTGLNFHPGFTIINMGISTIIRNQKGSGKMDSYNKFEHFVRQIPTGILAKTEVNLSENIAVFRPTSYVVGVEVFTKDYHFCLPVTVPPPMRIEKREYSFGKGKLIAFAPDTRMYCEKDIVTRPYIALNLKKQFMTNIIREACGKEDLPLKRDFSPYSRKLTNLISALEEEIKLYKCSCPIMLESIEIQLAIQLLRDMGLMPESETRPLERNYTNLAIEYLKTHYYLNIKTEDICKQIHISPYHFMRTFKKETGMTVHDYLKTLRMEKAEEMLKKGSHSIEEISRLCGFSSVSHFSNSFKRYKGISPSRLK